MFSLMNVLIVAAVIVVIVGGAFVMFSKFYRKVDQGFAMIVNKLNAVPDVTFTGGMVLPIIHRAELMEIARKTIVIDRSGKEGLICNDNIRADIKVTFFIRVNQTAQSVLQVAQTIGCARASDPAMLENLFAAKFSEALKTVGKSLDFVDLYQERDRFRDEIKKQIGTELSGYVMDDVAIDYLEQTPIAKLDPENILDAQGIRKITELTAIEHVRTNEFERNEQMQIKKKDVETQETILELERQQADATARQQREIATIQAREKAEADKVRAEENAKAEGARILSEQQIAVQQENMMREKEVAENNRKRAVAIEEEKVTRARNLEIVDREREVALQEIEKDKALETQKKAIADIVRERIVVERTVAEQEEAIKEVRIVSEANRTKQATVITAEAEAQEKFVLDVKQAEAQEAKARFKAGEELTLAEARLKVAEKEAESKKREAEGIEAITAAPGYAEAKVQIMHADAMEKQGMAEARVKVADADALRARLEAEADGKQKLGMADVQVKSADADAVAKFGLAEAQALRAKLEAEADGKQKLGMADVEVKSADAGAIEARYLAEAKGLHEKFEAMKTMSPDTRAHEEFRLRLDNAHIETMKAIEVSTGIAQEQAHVLAAALANAKFDIVGGEGDYFERFVQSLGLGKTIDGVINKSGTLQTVFKDHLSGERNLLEDAKGLIGSLGASSGELQNLSAAALLSRVATNGSTEQKAALQTLLNSFGNK